MSIKVFVHSNAFCKMMLHAAKYPYLAINGILLSNQSQADENELSVVDAVPLFHQQLGLAPMLEVALIQIEQFYKTKNMVICGYYQANEHLQDNTHDFVAMKITQKIAENMDNACLLLLDNKKMSMNPENVPFIVSHLTSGGKCTIGDKLTNIEAASLEITSHLLHQGVHKEIYDFDNHLDDLECDWENSHIDKLINVLASG